MTIRNGIQVNGYFYGVSDIVNQWWFDGKYTFAQSRYLPFIALQGGWESNSGQSYIGKINSQVFGAQLGFNVTRNIVLAGSYDQIPWQTDTVFLPKNVTCNNANYQISGDGRDAWVLPSEQRRAVLQQSQRHDEHLLRRLGEPVYGWLCDRSALHDEHRPRAWPTGAPRHVVESRVNVHLHE